VHIVSGPGNHTFPAHPVISEKAVLDDLVPGSPKVNMSGCIWRPVDKEKRGVLRMERFDLRKCLFLFP